MEGVRKKRVESALQNKIGSMIIGSEINDPRIHTMLTVTKLDISKDGVYADVFISSLQPENSLSTSIEALNHAAGFIQKHISKSIKLKNTPKLRFHIDTSIREGFEINEKMKDLNI